MGEKSLQELEGNFSPIFNGGSLGHTGITLDRASLLEVSASLSYAWNATFLVCYEILSLCPFLAFSHFYFFYVFDL